MADNIALKAVNGGDTPFEKKSVSGPAGPKPRPVVSARNIIVYGSLFVAAV